MSTTTIEMKLPPDPEGQNDDRAGWALVALEAFANETGLNEADTREGTTISDLLADLMHWCDRNDLTFDTMLERGRQHYAEETTEQQ